MSGENAFDWLKTIAILIAVIVLTVVGYYVWKYVSRSFTWLAGKPGEHNAIARGADSVVESVTGGAAHGGEDSVGGVFARIREWASGDDKRINDMLKGAPPKDPRDANSNNLPPETDDAIENRLPVLI